MSETNFWYSFDTDKDMWAVCSEHRGGYFIYTPDEEVAKNLTELYSLGEAK